MTTVGNRRATEDEIETARAWVALVTADWAASEDLNPAREAEYASALAVLKFANDRRASGGNR
jgi:hypothetical protein